jgi:hypothetical protein
MGFTAIFKSSADCSCQCSVCIDRATSGVYLVDHFKDYLDDVVPIVRNVEIKYKKPGKGELFSEASMEEGELVKARINLNIKGRALIDVHVQIFDLNQEVTMTSVFTWFVRKVIKSG